MSYQGISYNNRDWMIGWNISKKEMVVGPYPDNTNWSIPYGSTSGCCFTNVQNMTDEEIAECLRSEALQMISEGVPAGTVFEEFSKIRIWRDMRIKITAGDYLAFRAENGYREMKPYNPV